MRPALVALAAMVAAVTLIACGGGNSSGGGACGSTCNGCCLGTQCVGGTDVTGCGTGSRDCAVCTSGQVCSNGLCTGSSGTAAIGDACSGNAVCASGTCRAAMAGGGYCTADCSSAACPSGSACVTDADGARICKKTCANDGECRADYYCATEGAGKVCEPRIGAGCGADRDCGPAGMFCDLQNPAGYCSSACGGAQNQDCPSGSSCSSVAGTSACLRPCGAATDCRAGFGCTPDPAGGSVCRPRCTKADNSECAPGLKCNTTTGQCVSGGPAAGQLGGACSAQSECVPALGAGAFCSPAPPTGAYPNGYCFIDCLADSSVCTAGGLKGICVAFAADDHDCLSACVDSTDCRLEYYCYKFQSGNGACVPKCSDQNPCSEANTTCDKTSGLCVQAGAAASTTTEVVDLTPGGPINVPTNVLTAKVSVNVPQDAVSINFVGQAVGDPTARVVVYRIESSADGRLYDYATVGGKMKVQPPTGPGAFSVLFPNSPNVPYTTSANSSTCAASAAVDASCVRITLTLLASKQTTATVKAVLKHGPTRALTTGSVDLNLYFVGLTNLNASSAPSDANFQSIFDTVKTTWAKAGVTVDAGRVNYIDITGADAIRFRDLKDSELGELMKLSTRGSTLPNALNVFFVHTISGSALEGFIILGESAGIPGVPVLGTSGSGMAVTTADFPGGQQDIADTWAHEGGHWLGLFHPTESGGTAFDPLPDTPQCDKSHDANGDGKLVPQECVGFGADNEMFWTSVSSIAHSNLTPNQSFVLLRNPAVVIH